jgi:dienelactone hydrolase
MRSTLRLTVALWVLMPVLPLLGCSGGGGSGHPPDPEITVTVDSSATTVQAGATAALTATLQGDTSGRGVTWSISPASGAGTLSGPTRTTVTYNAPIEPPETELTVTITAIARDDASKSDAVVVTVSTLFVAIEPQGATVAAGGKQSFTASVQHDASQAGVTWDMVPSSGAGELVEVTSTSATYEAPPDPPPEDVDVTITATSIANPALAASATIVLPAITVQLTPESALVPVDATQAFAAAVSNDAGAHGVRWRLTQQGEPCAPACGSPEDIRPATVTFVAPAIAPPDVNVVLTARSVTSPARLSSAAIQISTGTVRLVPAALDFGAVKINSSRTKGTVLTNTGSAVLTMSATTIEGEGASNFSVKRGCGSSVSAGASCQIDVTFSPASFARHSAVLSIADSSSDSPQRIPLFGDGMPDIYTTVTEALNGRNMLVVPAPTGPHRVGTTTVELADSAREDPYLSDGTERELAVRFWYPAQGGYHCIPAPYTEADVWRHLSQLLRLPLPVVRTNSCLDAPIQQGVHPVVVFTHGYTGTLTDYTYLCEDLASRGYVVASIGHTFESTAVSFRNGRLATSVLGSHLTSARMDLKTLAFVESVRLADLRFLIDELPRLNTQRSGPFAGHLDMAGHSFGGLAALESGARDPRIRAVAVIDGVMPDSSFELTDTPVLILDAGRERWSADEEELWRKLRGQRWALNLKGAEHVAPSDLIWVARSAIKAGDMTPERMVAVTRDSVGAFFDASLRGLPVDPLLEQRSAGFREIEATGSVGVILP